jgi:putative sigma-54 modulation protein
MKISIRGDKVEITEAMKRHVEEKLEKIDKYLDNPDEVEAKVLVKILKDKQKVEVTIPLKNFILRAEEAQSDAYAAVDVLVDNIERQIRKNKSKLQDQSIKNYKNERNFAMDVINEIDEDDDEENRFNIVKRKVVEAKPMSEEEAILQMELLGHDFYLFKNQDTMKPTLVYKRKDDQYGIIETL